jgi:hypothetical protein
MPILVPGTSWEQKYQSVFPLLFNGVLFSALNAPFMNNPKSFIHFRIDYWTSGRQVNNTRPEEECHCFYIKAG